MILRHYKTNKIVKSLELENFLKLTMKGGNYPKMFNKVYLALILIKEMGISTKPVQFFEKAILKAGPIFFLKSQKSAGRSYLIPNPCRHRKKIFLGSKFLVEGAKKSCERDGLNFTMALVNELQNLYSPKSKHISYTIRKKREFLNNVLKYKYSARFIKKY